MILFPAIDLLGSKAVRLYKGDYDNVTVYSSSPLDVAKSFKADGAEFLHVVDLDGARDGSNANFETIKKIISESGLKVEVGGGIRSEETVEKYLSAGAFRVILGTAAITEPDFLKKAVEKHGEKIAVGADIKDGFVAIKGWKEVSSKSCFDFFKDMSSIGVKTIICTDISKDGVLSGTNLELYRELSAKFNVDIVASGGVSSLDDIRALKSMNIYGAILGKALYAGMLSLRDAAAEVSE